MCANQITSLSSTSAYCDNLYVTFKTNKTKNTTIGVYYRHNLSAKTDILGFIDEFENHITHKKLKNSKIIISGDINLDLLKLSTNINIESYFNCLLANNLECHITKPTRIAYYKNSLQIRSATLIDHICSNILDTDCIAGNFYYAESDHFPNFVLFEDYFDRYEPINTKKEIYRRNTSKIDKESLFNDMEDINWYNLVCNDEIDLDSAVNNLFDNLQNLCDKHAPKVKVSKRKMKYCHKPWIDSDLLNIIRCKNDMYRKMKKLPTLTNINLFKQMRNEVNHKTRYKKKVYFDNYFKMHKKNMKKSWEGIRYAMELSNNRKDIPNTMIDKSNGISYNNTQSIVNQFALYFESVPINCRKKLTNNNTFLDSNLCYACCKPTGVKYAICSICNSKVHKKCINTFHECNKCNSPYESPNNLNTHNIPLNNTKINNKFSQYLQASNINSAFFYDSTPIEVYNHILELKNNSSSGPSDIPNIFMKIISYQLSLEVQGS